MSIIHVFFFGNVLLDITSIFNTLELINNIQITNIALAKIPEHKGSISTFGLYGQLPNHQLHVFSFTYPVDEFSFKEMRMWDWFKITFYCICDWCESGETRSRRSSRFPCVTAVVENLLRQSCKTSMTELLCENSQWPKHVDFFCKRAPPQTSDWILNADPIRGAVNVGCGWNVSAWNL